MLDLATGERHKLIAFQEVEDTLPEKVCDDAYVVPEVKAVTEVYTLVAVVTVVV